MRVLVTGGGGFIGSHLATALVDAGYETVIYDNFSRFSEEKLRNVVDKSKIVKGDIKDLNKLTETVPGAEVVVHLAAVSRVDASIVSHINTFEINGTGTLNILEYCRRFGSKLIFASSWMVYDPGEAAKMKPLSEEAKTGPITPYGVSKLFGEQCCRLFSYLYHVPTIVLRFSNVYGLGDKERLIPLLISKAKRDDEIHIFGKEQTLNFVHVEDIVNAVCLVISNNVELTANTFNIGTERSIRLMELASKIISLCGSASKLVINPHRPFDYKYYQPDITKAKTCISYEPKVGLQNGIKKCVEYYP